MKIAPKIRVFMWLTCKNAIATKGNLYQRHISPNPYCTLCNHNVPETIEHMFFFCTWTRDIWTHYKVRVSISPTFVRCFDEWVAARAIIPKASPDFEVLANLLWEIWR